MNEIIKKNGVTFGIILGLFSILFTTSIYAIDLKLFTSWWIGLFPIAATIVIAIILETKTKKDLNGVLIRPHITEKATIKSESSVYVFEIDPKATKVLVNKAFIEKYKLYPLRINTVTIMACPRIIIIKLVGSTVRFSNSIRNDSTN